MVTPVHEIVTWYDCVIRISYDQDPTAIKVLNNDDMVKRWISIGARREVLSLLYFKNVVFWSVMSLLDNGSTVVPSSNLTPQTYGNRSLIVLGTNISVHHFIINLNIKALVGLVKDVILISSKETLPYIWIWRSLYLDPVKIPPAPSIICLNQVFPLPGKLASAMGFRQWGIIWLKQTIREWFYEILASFGLKIGLR